MKSLFRLLFLMVVWGATAHADTDWNFDREPKLNWNLKELDNRLFILANKSGSSLIDRCLNQELQTNGPIQFHYDVVKDSGRDQYYAKLFVKAGAAVGISYFEMIDQGRLNYRRHWFGDNPSLTTKVLCLADNIIRGLGPGMAQSFCDQGFPTQKLPAFNPAFDVGHSTYTTADGVLIDDIFERLETEPGKMTETRRHITSLRKTPEGDLIFAVQRKESAEQELATTVYCKYVEIGK